MAHPNGDTKLSGVSTALSEPPNPTTPGDSPLLSTQRPSKVHPNALSQCDNLALMRMSSAHDLAELGLAFGYAPADLLERAMGFTQGQALFAGGFAPEPQLIQVGKRLTEEGGSDVAVPLR